MAANLLLGKWILSSHRLYNLGGHGFRLVADKAEW